MTSNLPVVSIVMPLYNKGSEVYRAVNSVLEQTVTDFELVVINDGSTDRSPEIVRSFQDSRIKVIDQANAGVSAARNRGIDEAKSDLVVFLDADDEWETDFLEAIINLRSKFPECEVFATSYYFSSPKGCRRQATIRGLTESPCVSILDNYFVVAAKSDPPLWTSAVGVTKRAILSVGGFPMGIYSGEDLLTWARLAANYKIAYANRPHAVHWNPETVSDRPGRVPQIPDIVEEELVHLMESIRNPKKEDINAYIGLWHRMRAIVYIQLRDRRHAIAELRKAAAFSKNIKVYLLMLIVAVPFYLADKFLSFWRHLKRAL